MIYKKGIKNGVADHLLRIKVEDGVPIDDFLPTENVHMIENGFIGSVRMVTKIVSNDTSSVLIDT